MSAAVRLAALPLLARRSLALLLLVLAVLLAWALVLVPVRALVSSQEAWRESTQDSIATDRGTLAQAESLRLAGEAMKSSPLPARLYATQAGGGPELQLQDDLRAALSQSGVEPTNFKVLPAEPYRQLRAHRVEFASNMTIDQLQAFFLALDSGPHFVRIERLQLSAPAAQRVDENPRINVLMEARGYSHDAAPNPVRVAHAN